MGPSIFLSFSKMKSVCATLIYHHLECPLSTHHTLTIKIPRIRSKRWLSGLSSLPPSLITSAHHQVPCGETSSCKMTSDLHSLPEARARTHTHTLLELYTFPWIFTLLAKDYLILNIKAHTNRKIFEKVWYTKQTSIVVVSEIRASSWYIALTRAPTNQANSNAIA